MADVLVGTDVFLDHLRGARAFAVGRRRIAYSVITRCELFAGTHGDEEVVKALLAPFSEIPIDRNIAERAGRLRRASRIRTPDALIAASAQEHRMSLITRNVRDFESVRGLRLESPD